MSNTRSQLTLAVPTPEPSQADATSLPQTFRNLYYHLYSNSRASRAERILEDLALLLLLKLAIDENGVGDAVREYCGGRGTANHVLIPILEQAYPNLVASDQQFNIGDVALRATLSELDGVNLAQAPAHALGEAFQALIGPRLRGDKGQFFTPRSLVRAMIRILSPTADESVLDPACGTGGFLAEVFAYREESGVGNTGVLVGVDKDHDLFRLAAAMLRITAGSKGSVHNFNSLSDSQWAAHVGRADFDVVMTNPPFGSRIAIRDKDILADFDLGHRWILGKNSATWTQTKALFASQDPQLLFLELCIRKLRHGGRLGIVLPEGVFGNKKSGYVWDWVREQGEIVALLDCPRTTFQPGTDTKTNVLFFRKSSGNCTGSAKNTVSVSVALSCGHDRRGRTHYGDGTRHPDDFPGIADSYGSADEDKHWRDVTITNPYYLVPRYYVPEEPRTPAERDLVEHAPVKSLKELIHEGVISIRKGHEVGSAAYGTGNIPFVRTSDVSNLEISTDPTKSVSEAVYQEYAKQQKLSVGDILIVVDGRYRIGTTALISPRTVRSVIQSHFRIVSVRDSSKLTSEELLFALNLPSVRIRMRNLVFIQSTLGTIGKRLLGLEVPILHGDGPWRGRVDRFGKLVQTRDALLAELATMIEPEVEL